jgi:hypothetical protein
MALIKGRYKSVEVAADGSSIKVRTSDGSAIRIETDDLESLVEDILKGMVAAKLDQTAQREGATATKYLPLPPVINASDVNVNHHPDTDTFTLEASNEKGRRLIAVLQEKHVRFLFSVYQQTRSQSSAHGPH